MNTETTARILLEQVLLLAPPDLANKTRSAVLAAMDEGKTEFSDKLILDACCGSRMFWFDKQNPLAIFLDNRSGVFEASNGIKAKVFPDMVADFRSIPFEDNLFKLVVFDPPHRSDLTSNNWMAQRYGKLLPTWETDLALGFNECMRVLDFGGTLIFKWNEKQIKLSKVLKAIGQQPLFGHTSGKTIWMAFMKHPLSK